MVRNELLKDAIYGLLYFSVVVGLISVVKSHGTLAIAGVLFACTFCLYWFFYKIRDVKHYILSFAMLSIILIAFQVAGKIGVGAILALYIVLPIWIIWSRRKKVKEAYKEFETVADKVFDKKEKKPVKAKKPSRTSKKNKSEHKQKDKARQKNTSKTRKPRTVKKRSKDSGKKSTSN